MGVVPIGAAPDFVGATESFGGRGGDRGNTATAQVSRWDLPRAGWGPSAIVAGVPNPKVSEATPAGTGSYGKSMAGVVQRPGMTSS
ncbi:hypothetical protein BH23GEM8_BH23GEM8_14540 [soil metagenome]